jgi:MoxR-like ATPase
VNQILSREDILTIQKYITESVYVDDKIYEYVANIVHATRNPKQFGYTKGENLIEF